LPDVKEKGFSDRLIEVFGTDKPAEIQRKTGIPYHTVRNYLKGRLPEADVLLIIAAVTNVSIHWLLTGEGPKIIKRVDFKNLWSRIVKAWEKAVSEDRSLKADLEFAKGHSERNFLPEFKLIERVSNLTHAPILWLLTGEGPSQAEQPLGNAPAYLADLIVDYQAKEKLPLPLRNKLMSTEAHNEKYISVQGQQRGNQGTPHSIKIPFSQVEQVAINKLASQMNLTADEIIRQIVSAHLMTHGLVSIQEIIRSTIANVVEEEDLEAVPEYDDSIPQETPAESPPSINDLYMPEGVGLLFKDWDKISDEDKIATLKQIEGIVKEKTSKPGRRNKK
jgi:transcriptional regulator with XRE-family HTH domain